MYPDQSLYPANTGPELAKRINRALQRADQVEHSEGGAKRDWFAPIVADAEAGFGGPLNCFEIMKAYIEAGVGGVHFEDQLASEKKCGHLGGKVLIPTQAAVRNLDAARLAADICGVPTLIVARTDAESAKLITSDVDERDQPFLTGERTPEGFFRLKDGTGLDHCISRGLAFAEHGAAKSIKVSLSLTDTHIRLKVADDGCGMSLKAALATSGVGLKVMPSDSNRMAGKMSAQ